MADSTDTDLPDLSALQSAGGGAAPAPSGGGGGLMSALSRVDPSLLIHVGAGLMAGARYGSNFGEGLMMGMQSYQQARAANQQYQQNQLGLMWQRALLGQKLNALQGGGGIIPQSPGQPGATPAAPAGLMQPSSALAGQTAPAAMGGLPPPPTASGIFGANYPGGIDTGLGQALAYGSQNPIAELSALRETKQKGAQAQYAPIMERISYALQAQNPRAALESDQLLKEAWPSLAQSIGMDPKNDYDDSHVRQALTHLYNTYAAPLQMPQKDVQLPVKHEGLREIEPISGKTLREEELKPILADGQPQLVPESKAVGKTPYSPSLYGTQNLTDQSREFAYQYYLQHQSLPPGLGRSPSMQSDMLNYIAGRAKQEGQTQTSILANSQANKNVQGVVKDFTSGATSKAINGLNTAIGHMGIMERTVTALGNGDIRALNAVQNFFGREFGSSVQTNLDIVKDFASKEVAKANLPGGGTGGERDTIASAIANSSSPKQLMDALGLWRELLASKTDTIRNQWNVGTMGTQGPFEKFLTAPTKAAVASGSTQHPADIQDLLKKYGNP